MFAWDERIAAALVATLGKVDGLLLGGALGTLLGELLMMGLLILAYRSTHTGIQVCSYWHTALLICPS